MLPLCGKTAARDPFIPVKPSEAEKSLLHVGQAPDTRLKLLTKDASRTDIFCHISRNGARSLEPAATDIMSLAELAASAWSEAVDVHWEDYQASQGS